MSISCHCLYRLILPLAAAAAASQNKDDEDGTPAAKDEDPDGHKVISVETPLEEAAKLLQPLSARKHANIDIWVITYDVAIRRSKYVLILAPMAHVSAEKYLQALKSINAAFQLEPNHPLVHSRLVDIQVIGMVKIRKKKLF